MATSCQKAYTPSAFSPLRKVAMMSTPISEAIRLPWPPNRLVPPITTAAIESSS